MKKWAFGTGILLVLAVGLFQIPGVHYGLVALTLPAFPDWPEPQTRLRPEDKGAIYFPTASPFDLQVIFAGMTNATPTTGLGYLSYPPAASEENQVPAMVILPGSGGITPGREHEYAQFLNAHGIAAFVVEYYAPRGLSEATNYLIKTSSVTEFDLIVDAFSALKLLSTSPLIAVDRIGVMGFSYGGMASRLTMDDRFKSILAPSHKSFAVHIDVYGPCFQNLRTTRTDGAPLLTLRGTEDASNDLEACALREQEMRDTGSYVQTYIYEGAAHAWENETPQFLSESSPYITGCELRYDEAGVPMLNGEPVTGYNAAAGRVQRIAARLGSGSKLRDCVKYGYLTGRDEQTREQAYADVLAFLRKHL